MRRARIKPILNAPVRRKVLQDEPVNQENDPRQSEKLLKEITSELSDENISNSILKKKAFQNHLEHSTIFPDKETKSDRILNHTTSTIKVLSPIPKSSPNVLIQSAESSQTKISNRSSFMKPTPRLDGSGRIRKNSLQGSATSGASAGESEDDSRKSNSMTLDRMPDQVCTSDKLLNVGVSESNSYGNTNHTGKLNFSQKRRLVVSESARKLAEARREFLLKHENNTPDKSKLTMYDLIYYNPKSNPMKSKPVVQKIASRKISLCLNSDEKDDQAVEEVELNSKESSEILVPQLKIGPNGQLVIDEKSIVIDQHKTQENINRSDILIDDDGNGNGFYKRRAKSKDWNKWETMKFYKALSTYGTDFLLMQSVFPKRSRQELKLKYKKEEKFNNNLVEKALRYQEFDTDALKKDLANVEENERKEAESIKMVKKYNFSGKTKKKTKNKRCRAVAREVNCEDTLETSKNFSEEQSSDENSRISIIKTKRHKKKKRIHLEDSDSGEKTTRE